MTPDEIAALALALRRVGVVNFQGQVSFETGPRLVTLTLAPEAPMARPPEQEKRPVLSERERLEADLFPEALT